ncbi:similar to glycoside hydrolase family 16 [Plenodomus lingam JN3]|uniref:Similar to glycoside hydrolase family 16 n=1 Tax=Leptosphaeria maculans (strain JN3 / isolate v23.1.3 / race Av1-4-5-6-7-8) TaxID=985895 RepID=E4ZH64_LEPMJ|nr:similar to glycoside hydrolase family 16 [Plenodomus lingam JN3]CBX90634.1 similar to glycoside hydrolase family 16 [Plenodomus lingam JN3]
MHFSAASALLLATAVSAVAPIIDLIPSNAFNSKTYLEKYFDYGYPWGTGAAFMDPSHVTIPTPGVLRLTAQPVSGKRPVCHNPKIIINYLSGAVHSKQNFTVTERQGFAVNFKVKAPVVRGTWPAVWLLSAESWPPEVDIAEFKGSGKISMNTYNTSSQVTGVDLAYPDPDEWHSVSCSLMHKTPGKDVEVRFWLNDKVVSTQYAKDYVGKPMRLIINLQMEGSSKSPGPKTDTTFSIKDFTVSTL